MIDRLRDEPEVESILGDSERVIQRLSLQADLVRPITDRLLRCAGIRQRMRVLDLGCGPGDLSMLAAELVGPLGSVVGIDRSPDLIAIARQRAQEAGLWQIRFENVPAEDFADPEPFDLVIGRDVLIHQAEAVALIEAAAGFVRPGGMLAFQELNLHSLNFQSLPLVPLWQRIGDWLEMAFRDLSPYGDAGGRLIELFACAGLPQPNLFCEAPLGGGKDSLLYAWAAETVESLRLQLGRVQARTQEAHAVETLEARLRAAVVEARSQIVGPTQFCAWSRV